MQNLSALLYLFFSLTLITSSCSGDAGTQEQEAAAVEEGMEYPTAGSIERFDPGVNDLIAEEAEIEVLAAGFNWSEGPLWLPDEELLIFSDVPENRIYQWKEGDTVATVYLEPSGFTGDGEGGREPGSNGLALNAEGQLILCQHGNRQLARMDAPLSAPAPRFIPIAETYEGQRFNSPNDLVIDSKGNTFFTDPPYGLSGGVDDPAKEIPFQGVYRISPEGEVNLLIDSLTRPNGIGLSPDERTLYVAVSDPDRAWWLAYGLDEAGQVTGGGILLDATPDVPKAKGLPDGLKVHSSGAIFASGPGGIWVISAEGQHLGTIRTGQATANCGFNADESMLYMTADSLLMRIKVGG